MTLTLLVDDVVVALDEGRPREMGGVRLQFDRLSGGDILRVRNDSPRPVVIVPPAILCRRQIHVAPPGFYLSFSF